MKHLEGTQALGQDFLRYLDLLPEDTSLYKPYRYMTPPPKGYSFCPFSV